MKQWLLIGMLAVLSLFAQAQSWPADDDVLAWRNLTAGQVSKRIHGGADVNKRFEFDETPLMRAALFSSSADTLRALVDAGAEVDARTDEGITALMQAAGYNDNPEITKALLDAGAKIDALALVDLTALMMAAENNGNPEVVKVLLAAGADVHARATGSLEGKTALMWAAEQNPNPLVVEALLDAGADPTAKDAEGRSAADYGRENPALRDSGVYRRLNVRFSPAFLSAEGYAVDTAPVDIMKYSDKPSDMYGVPDFYFLGWSPGGAFAFIENRSLEGIGGTRTRYVVFDAIEDTIVFQATIDDTDLQNPADHGGARAAFLRAVEETGIRVGAGTEFRPFPLELGQDRFTCEIATAPEKDEDARMWFDEIGSYEVMAHSRLLGVKRITGSDDVFAKSIWIAGYVSSPFELRILVVVGKEEFVFEGTEAFFLFSGCSLKSGFRKD